MLERAIQASISRVYPLQVLGAVVLSFQQCAPVAESTKR